MVLKVLSAHVVAPFCLDLIFNNGVRKMVDLRPIINGPVFEPLKDPDYFARVVVDHVIGTTVWPNEADFAPEALLELPSLERISTGRAA